MPKNSESRIIPECNYSQATDIIREILNPQEGSGLEITPNLEFSQVNQALKNSLGQELSKKLVKNMGFTSVPWVQYSLPDVRTLLYLGYQEIPDDLYSIGLAYAAIIHHRVPDNGGVKNIGISISGLYPKNGNPKSTEPFFIVGSEFNCDGNLLALDYSSQSGEVPINNVMNLMNAGDIRPAGLYTEYMQQLTHTHQEIPVNDTCLTVVRKINPDSPFITITSDSRVLNFPTRISHWPNWFDRIKHGSLS